MGEASGAGVGAWCRVRRSRIQTSRGSRTASSRPAEGRRLGAPRSPREASRVALASWAEERAPDEISETGVETMTQKPHPTWIHRDTLAAPLTKDWYRCTARPICPGWPGCRESGGPVARGAAPGTPATAGRDGPRPPSGSYCCGRACASATRTSRRQRIVALAARRRCPERHLQYNQVRVKSWGAPPTSLPR